MGHGEVETATRFPLLHTPDDGYVNSEIAALHSLIQWHKRSGTTAYMTIAGFEVMRALRKRQAAIFNLTRDICGEMRIVERAFGIAPSALTETIALIEKTLNLQPA